MTVFAVWCTLKNLFISRISHLNWVRNAEPVFEWYIDKVGKYRFRLKLLMEK